MSRAAYALRDTPDARTIAALELEFPRWQVWVVYPVVSPKTWCARRWADEHVIPGETLNAGSALELIDKITESVSGEENDS